jgi:hypothetical protein
MMKMIRCVSREFAQWRRLHCHSLMYLAEAAEAGCSSDQLVASRTFKKSFWRTNQDEAENYSP